MAIYKSQKNAKNMNISQIYTGCLSQGAYYIESNGEAAIIDPLRDVNSYLKMAESRNAKIKYIFETHFHADFVSGHIDLSRITGAPIIFGPTSMNTGYEILQAEDGQEFLLGNARIRIIHTPGHTPESSCYLLIDETGKEIALFSGDTLFIDDVGRPDLAQKLVSELTAEKLAGMLYDSLRNKIIPLSDDIIVYPAHGAGSACGKKMSEETHDTLGHQKATNYALNPKLTREDFIKSLIEGLTPPPGYFPQNVMMNIAGYEPFEEIIKRGVKPLSAKDFDYLSQEKDVLVIDTRNADKFAEGFIPGSINIGIDGSFAVWVGTVIPDIKQKILVVTDPWREEEVITRLSRVGYDHCLGFLEGGFDAWAIAGKKIDKIEIVTAEELFEQFQKNKNIPILDVRKHSEFQSEHIENARNLPLDYYQKEISRIQKEDLYYVHCAAGYRSMIFISMLRAKGYSRLVDINGGFKALKSSGKFPITKFKEPVTLL